MDADEILRITAHTFWVPPESEHLQLDGFEMVRYDNGFHYDTGVYAVNSDLSAPDVIAAAERQAVEWGRHALYWNGLTDRTRPADLAGLLRDRGGVELERMAILALDLTAGRPDLDVPADVTTIVPMDRRTCEDSEAVAAEAFETPVRPVRDEDVEGQRHTVDSGSGTSYVAYLDGRPAATGGVTFHADGTVAKLWGGSSARWARGRGAYRGVLDSRLRAAADRGCRIALVSGRLETSAPTLRRAGFRSYGEEFMLRVPVDSQSGNHLRP
ncbi:hypothetical protein [Flexivirga alba]|uniref:N-acetyltransferase domain-containing protein n=1 Tax=Flexivirga alba TaxID=702742 RepID=A0ABW2AL80_9MICO